MGTVALVLLVVLLLVVLALAAPVTVWVDVRSEGGLRARARLRALYGLIRADLTGRRRTPKPRKPRPRRRPTRGWQAAVRTEGFLSAVRRLVARTWRALEVKELRGLVRVGFDDPSATGMAWGVLGPVSWWSARRWPEFRALPSFDGAELAVDVHGAAAVVPLRLVLVALVFFFTPATVRALITARRSR